MLIGAMNPCLCGFHGDPVQECTCSNAMVSRYQARTRHAAHLRPAAGPDRPSAAHIEVPPGAYEKLSDDRMGESSAAIRKWVEAAQSKRTRMLAAADMGPGEVRDYYRLDDAGKRSLWSV